MEPRDLSIDEFNALYYLSEQTNPIGIVSINSIPVLQSQSFLESLNDIVLTANAVAYIRDISEDSAKPEVISLVEKISGTSDSFRITKEGREYVEYYKEYVLR
jgi:hypothetical protein